MRKVISLIASSFFFAVGCASVGEKFKNAEIEDRTVTVFEKKSQGYDLFRIPALVKAADGSLIAFAEARRGKRHDTGDIDLVMRRSEDEGRTWGPLTTVWDDGDNTCGNPAPVVVGTDGLIIMLASWNHGDDIEKDIECGLSKDSRRVFLLRSIDHGRTWEAPEEITPSVKKPEWTWYATGPVHAIVKKNDPHRGRIVVSANHKFLAEDGSVQSRSHLLYSDDNGQSWNIGAESSVGGNESTVAETSEGTLILNMRHTEKADSLRLFAVSADGGETWVEEGEFAGLPEPQCQGSMLNLCDEDGQPSSTLLFSNPRNHWKRENLCLSISRDNGRSWNHLLTVNPSHSAYSDMVQMGEKRIGVLFEHGEKHPYERISFVTVSSSESGVQPFNRAPLKPRSYSMLPLGAVRADGWLLEQQRRMRDGMTGNLDKIYPQVMNERNAWLGGDGDAWERGPYWIDGLLPLAYQLDDKKLKDKAQQWVEWSLASQREDGYFGPYEDREPEPGIQRDNAQDWWPKMVVLKIMQQYYSATGDRRVIDFMTRYFRYQLEKLPDTPLDNWTHWGADRGGDNLNIVYWLYNITGDKFLLELGELIHKQSYDWAGAFTTGDELFTQTSLHCVNLAQGFKEPAIYWQQSGDSLYLKSLDEAKRKIRMTIGFPTGLWAGDEMLQYGDPTQGSELCTAVEMMYSLEEILSITGEGSWADYIERIAYNVLPTQVSDDCMARLYYHQINQIEVSRTDRCFTTPHKGTGQLFGTLTGYPCCTSNWHQGWPKFTQNLWYSTPEGGLAALLYAPSKVRAKVAGGYEVCIHEQTNYPFEEQISFRFSYPTVSVGEEGVSFPIHLRIPEWSTGYTACVNGESVECEDLGKGIVALERYWREGDCLTLSFEAGINLERWYDQSVVVTRGPLLYALKMNENWKEYEFKGDDRKEFGDRYYEVTSDSPWNFCFYKHHLREPLFETSFTFERSGSIAEYPWTLDGSSMRIVADAYRIPKWNKYNGSTGPINYFAQSRWDRAPEAEKIELIPFGCTTLRITEFPVR